MTNLDLVTLVFDRIKSQGYEIYDITHPDGYFICNMGKDSVTHFRIRKHGMWKRWKFGLWVNAEYMTEEEIKKAEDSVNNGYYEDMPKVISIFAQYDTCIDKFKPTRSALCVEYDADQVNDFISNSKPYGWYKLDNMLKMMCRHPFMCYEEYCGEGSIGYYTESFIWQFIKYESKYKIKKIQKALNIALWYPYTVAKCWIAKRDKCISSLKIYDFEKENPGWSTNFLYEVQVEFTSDATEKEECDWANRWFHRDEYGKVGAFNCVVSLDSFKKVGYDKRYTYS